jgi:hypothetical protein
LLLKIPSYKNDQVSETSKIVLNGLVLSMHVSGLWPGEKKY